jgi:hypothetical protein
MDYFVGFGVAAGWIAGGTAIALTGGAAALVRGGAFIGGGVSVG